MINKYTITWSQKAYRDLQGIHDYLKYYLKEKNIAKNISKKILNSVSTLSYLPEKYARVQNLYDKTKNIRKIPIDNYMVIYEVSNNTRTSIHSTYFSL